MEGEWSESVFPGGGDVPGSLQEWGGEEAEAVGNHGWMRISVVVATVTQGVEL